ncbi:hypothetical protein Pint_02652 [Pistacia integerrima]|uniref:Uncharacterized protein n=1 Tax=Pistacia integerrima TaxID=434235 RepID=A0ACC0ZK48_9ROSI|nr:hypothetical protein Pint_02652 [Pistacia integerrima]
MKFYSLFQETHGQYTRKERCVSIGKLVPFFLCSIVATIILSFFLYFPYPLNPLTRCEFQQMYAPVVGHQDYGIANCDLFKGHWEEVPKDIYKDPEDRLRIWNFRGHDFTLMTLWFRFLVVGDRKVISGSSEYYDLHLDKIDESWTTNLPTIDYAIIAVEHWFFRPIYFIQMTFRAAFKYINDCSECRGIVTVVRTFPPSHFEDGSWNTGGSCNRTSPIEETERARTEGDKKGKSFVIMDVTKATLMRPDGHPGEFWGNKWMKGYNDCVHWCLPGPIDVWNEFLMAILEKETGLISS